MATKAGKKDASPTTPAKRVTYSQELTDEICEHIAAGLSAIEACKIVGVTDRAMYLWLNEYPDFVQRYAGARERQADKHAADILAISDEVEIEAKYNGDDVTLDLSANMIARNRLRVDARKWAASKLAPKKYGDKVAIGGADDLPAIQSKFSMSDEALIAIAAKKT